MSGSFTLPCLLLLTGIDNTSCSSSPPGYAQKHKRCLIKRKNACFSKHNDEQATDDARPPHQLRSGKAVLFVPGIGMVFSRAFYNVQKITTCK
jgi:NAD/NADP transhydrogenase beta subunit